MEEEFELPELTLKHSISKIINEEPIFAKKKSITNQTSTLSSESISKIFNSLGESEQSLDTLLLLIKFTNKLKL